MTWWAWTLLWIVLVAAAGLVIYLAVRRLLRQGMALARELGAAADLLSEVTRTLEGLPGEAAAAEAPTVEAARTARRGRPATRGSSRRRLKAARSQDVR